MTPEINDCKPGLIPMGYNILVAVDVTQETTTGGIILPSKTVDRDNSASERGRIAGVSDMAFRGGDWTGAEVPAIGQEVVFQRYAGTEYEGGDGLQYRIIADSDLKGVLT